MSIDFGRHRWDRIKRDAEAWWAGELDRPLMQVRLCGGEAGRKEPPPPFHRFTSFYDSSVTAEAIVDRWDYELSRTVFLGDAFPEVWPNFGPGVLAAFVGAVLENSASAETSWFRSRRHQEIVDIQLDFDPLNPWLRRVKEICRAAMDRWDGLVQVSMTDLGGNLDVLSTFRPGTGLPLDLHDHPLEIQRLLWTLHELWWRCFDEIDQVIRPKNPGYTAWLSIFSTEPYYPLQCDFSYMVGPRMFDEFVKPELAESCRRLGNPFYHLDGRGQLAHLDSLLEIEELKGIQWVPGEGQPDQSQWPEVYRKIRSAGKLIEIFGGSEVLDAVVDQLGSAKGIVWIVEADISEEEEMLTVLERYGAL